MRRAVCIAVLEKVDAMLEGKAKTNKAKIEAAIDQFCSKKDLSQQDKKLVSKRVRMVVAGWPGWVPKGSRPVVHDPRD